MTLAPSSVGGEREDEPGHVLERAADAVISDEASVPLDLLKWAMPAMIGAGPVGEPGERVERLPDLPVDVGVEACR